MTDAIAVRAAMVAFQAGLLVTVLWLLRRVILARRSLLATAKVVELREGRHAKAMQGYWVRRVCGKCEIAGCAAGSPCRRWLA